MRSTSPVSRSNVLEVDSFTALLRLTRRFSDSHKEWAFRGIPGNSSRSIALGDLQTTFDRVAEQFSVRPSERAWLEKTLVIEFMRRYHLYHTAPPPRPGDTLEWLALMAHYGAPTRFLDFTYSLPIAAFFALERFAKAPRRSGPMIWALDKTWLTKRVAELHGSGAADELKAYAVTRAARPFRRLFFRKKPLTFVAPLSAFRLNERLTIQQGLFLCSGDVRKPFAQNLEVMLDGKAAANLKVIRIERRARDKILSELHNVNIHRASLFPGLDGFAASLWTRVPSLQQMLVRQKTGKRLGEQDFAGGFDQVLETW